MHFHASLFLLSQLFLAEFGLLLPSRNQQENIKPKVNALLNFFLKSAGFKTGAEKKSRLKLPQIMERQIALKNVEVRECLRKIPVVYSEKFFKLNR